MMLSIRYYLRRSKALSRSTAASI